MPIKISKEKKAVYREMKNCCVCQSSDLYTVLDLPGLPLTGIFVKKSGISSIFKADQSLLWCASCGHAQLVRQVAPGILYNSKSYSFKTSISATAKEGTGNFLRFLNTFNSGVKYRCILDVGCNDLHLLNEMKPLGRYRVGIDPIWSTQNPPRTDKSLSVIGKTIEETDLNKVLPCRPDLIVCRHTLEHISNPVRTIVKLMDCAAKDAIFVFEFPSFEFLINQNRFDHVFHEHLQYFSLNSFKFLLKRCGGELLSFEYSPHNWGVLIVAFKRSNTKSERPASPLQKKAIDESLKVFKAQMSQTRDILMSLKSSSIYGYGAALMLPVLAYHLNSDLSFLKFIIDDNRDKDGLYYANLPLRICHPGKIKDYEESQILITALDNVGPIMKKLVQLRPKNIICPFQFV